MWSSDHATPVAWGMDPRGAVDAPAVSSMAPASKIKKNCFRAWLEKVTAFLNIFEDPPRDHDVPESVWCQPACGFVLTLMYLVGVIVIIVLFAMLHGCRSPAVRIKYVSAAKILDGSMEDYFCMCDLPAQIHSYSKDDPDTQTSSRSQRLNRCYTTDEVQDIDVLQFGNDTVVELIIQAGKLEKTPYVKTFRSTTTVSWKSYELTSRKGDLSNHFTDSVPISNFSEELEQRGYVRLCAN